MTIKLHHLRPAPGAKTEKTRVGRGEGSKGKTAGRGTKGTKARKNVPAAFEGGQMPLHMRLPKLKGFKNRFRTEYQVVNVGRLAKLFPEGGAVGIDDWSQAGAVARTSSSRFSATARSASPFRSPRTSSPAPPRRRSPPPVEPPPSCQAVDERVDVASTAARVVVIGPIRQSGSIRPVSVRRRIHCCSRTLRDEPGRRSVSASGGITARRSQPPDHLPLTLARPACRPVAMSSRQEDLVLSAFVSAFRTPDLTAEDPLHARPDRAVPARCRRCPRPASTTRTCRQCIEQVSGGDSAGIYQLINLFSGGALLQLSVFAIGIMPYITASIIVQLLTVVIPRFEELRKEGQSGQTKMTQYTRYLSIALGGPAGHRPRRAGRARSAAAGLQRADHRRHQHLRHDHHRAGDDRRRLAGHVVRRADHRARHRQRHVAADLRRYRRAHPVSRARRSSTAAAVWSSPWCVSPRWRSSPAVDLRRAGPAPHSGAVRQAHGRPQDVRRLVDVPAAEGEPGRRHPGHLRVLAAVPAEPDRAADRSEHGDGAELVAARSSRPTWSTRATRSTSRSTSR